MLEVDRYPVYRSEAKRFGLCQRQAVELGRGVLATTLRKPDGLMALLKWPTYIVPRQLNDAAVAHFLTPRPCNSLSALR